MARQRKSIKIKTNKDSIQFYEREDNDMLYAGSLARAEIVRLLKVCKRKHLKIADVCLFLETGRRTGTLGEKAQ